MKIPQMLAGLLFAASLFLAPILSTAHAATSLVGKHTSAAPSVPGGAPITVTVYNYLPNPQTVYFVDGSGTLQLVSGVGPVPQIAGSAPFALPSFIGATLYFRGPKGWVTVKHFNSATPPPFVLIGKPPAGAPVPPGYKGSRRGGAGGPAPGVTAPSAPGTPPVVINKSVVNKSVVNNPPPTSTPAPAAKGRKGGAKAPDINVTINPPAPSTGTPASGEGSAAGPPPAAQKDDPQGEPRPLRADDPLVVEFLRIHNAARADVGVSPLEWSEDLAVAAQDWAEDLAATGKLEHQPDSEYGENLASGMGNYTLASAANAWLAEKAGYSPEKTEYRTTTIAKGKGGKTVKREEDVKTAHYSQMIWGMSTMVGVGIARTGNGKVVVVANYNPRGNIKGEKAYGQ